MNTHEIRRTIARAFPPAPLLVAPSIEALEDDHEIQRTLCDELEGVADALPTLPALPEIRRLGDRLLLVTSTHFRRAEEAFRNLPARQRPSEPALRELQGMHRLDEIHAQDLVSVLWREACSTAADRNPVELAYMLRCFFDGCRRAIAIKESWMSLTRRAAVTSA